MTSSFFSDWGPPSARLLRQGIAWWLAELARMLPGPLLRLAPGKSSPAATLEFALNQAFLALPGGTGPRATLPLPAVPDAETRLRVQAALDRQRQGNGVTVRLDSALVFETSLDLPAAAESSMRAILQHQLERIVPLPPASVCFEYRLAERRPNGATLRVHLAIVKREIIDRTIAHAEAAGLRPKRIVAQAAERIDARRSAPYVFWRAGQNSAGNAAHKRLRRILELLVVLTAIFAYGSYVYRLDAAARRLRMQLEQTRQEAAGVQELAGRVSRQRESASFFQARRRELTSLRVLEAVTTLVPQDSWANQFALRGRTVDMMGFSAHAADLVARIEASPIFQNPHFRSPITLSPDGKVERFHLTFDIRRADPQ